MYMHVKQKAIPLQSHGPFHYHLSTHWFMEIIILYGHCWWTLDMSQNSCLYSVNGKIFNKWDNVQKCTGKNLKISKWFLSYLCISLFWIFSPLQNWIFYKDTTEWSLNIWRFTMACDWIYKMSSVRDLNINSGYTLMLQQSTSTFQLSNGNEPETCHLQSSTRGFSLNPAEIQWCEMW